MRNAVICRYKEKIFPFPISPVQISKKVRKILIQSQIGVLYLDGIRPMSVTDSICTGKTDGKQVRLRTRAQSIPFDGGLRKFKYQGIPKRSSAYIDILQFLGENRLPSDTLFI